MSIPLPESVDAVLGPFPDHQGGIRALTRLALSQALKDLAEAAIALIPTFGEEDLRPGAYSAGSRPLRVLYKRARNLSVLADRIVLGASWDDVDLHLGLQPGKAEAAYAEMERRWREGDPAPWAPVFEIAENAADQTSASKAAQELAAQVYGYPVDLSQPQALAEMLDRFCNRHLPRTRRDRSRWWNDPHRPVSGGLPR